MVQTMASLLKDLCTHVKNVYLQCGLQHWINHTNIKLFVLINVYMLKSSVLTHFLSTCPHQQWRRKW